VDQNQTFRANSLPGDDQPSQLPLVEALGTGHLDAHPIPAYGHHEVDLVPVVGPIVRDVDVISAQRAEMSVHHRLEEACLHHGIVGRLRNERE
jgi:hypothetical protein